MSTLLITVSSSAFAERNEDGGLARQYRDIQHHSQLFDVLQHYYFQSGETARAMQSTMNSRQLDAINQQLVLINKNLAALIALEKQRSHPLTTIKKG